MKILVVIVSTVYVVMATDCSDPKPKEPTCRINVKPDPNFNFDTFMGKQYRIVMLSEADVLTGYYSAYEVSFLLNKQWYFIFTVNFGDKSQVNIEYIIDKHGGAEIYETILVDDIRTLSYKVVMYAYKEDNYAQFLLCGDTGSQKDLRFALLFGDKEFTNNLQKELEQNDKKYKFNSKLVLIDSIKDKIKDPSKPFSV